MMDLVILTLFLAAGIAIGWLGVDLLPENLFVEYINLKGLPIFNKEEFLHGLEDEVLKVTKTFSLNNQKQQENLIEGLKKTCRKYVKEKTGKKPITNINVLKI